ncbi:ABC transporter permease [Sorangium sp. So ce327]|jgi:ribose transport system permease protein|uniref:ABC transporter permease n=1 Tax=unclassified Sorangium TaxID=2621164 RepID=UPI00236FB4A6|nr:rbsC4 [Steroidobacteraceae bacterium]
MKDWKLRLRQNQGLLVAVGLCILFYGLYSLSHPKGFSAPLIGQNANESFVLVAAAMAQTIPVLTGGLDLSVGAVITLVNCVASHVLAGSALTMFLGILLCLAVGMAAGLLNGCLVVYGRLQPIIATLASGTIFLGVALFLRPTPGGQVDGDLAFAATFDLNELLQVAGAAPLDGALGFVGQIPSPAIWMALLALLWAYYRRTRYGLGAYAVGASQEAAYMSGVRIKRVKLAAYTLSGFFASVGGLYLALQTTSGNADIPQAGSYTLNSIASVVIGGTSLYGGIGGAIGSLFGALVLRSVAFNFRVFDEGSALGLLANPLYQPLFEGLILLAAVCLGALWVIRVKNRLHVFR